MAFFQERYSLRLSPSIAKDISRIVKKDKGKTYDSASHFIRCAILRLIRTEKKRLR